MDNVGLERQGYMLDGSADEQGEVTAKWPKFGQECSSIFDGYNFYKRITVNKRDVLPCETCEFREKKRRNEQRWLMDIF